MEYYREVMDGIGRAIDSVRVLVIVAGAILATGRFIVEHPQCTDASAVPRASNLP